MTTRRRVGTVVTAARPAPRSPAATAVLTAAEQLAVQAHRAGMPEEDVLAAVRAALLRARTAPVPSR